MSLLNQLLNEYTDRDYTPADVLSKVSAAENKADNFDNSTKFGLQDSNGQVILVYVASDQAEDFEQALGMALANMDEGTSPEIAEVLFNLHDRFNIINVEWPTIQGDEEEEATDDSEFEDGEDQPMDDEDQPMDDEEDQPMDSMNGEEAPQETLDAILSMMSADAEAKRQEALARAAEARAREAEAAAKIADGKLRAEEEVADMEAFYDAKNEEQKEAKKLAKLAKYRHEVKTDDMEQHADDYADALAKQEDEDGLGMDTLSRDTEAGEIDAGIGGGAEGDVEMDNPTNDLETELDDFGVENEEDTISPDGPTNVNRRFKDIESTIKYLHSLKVQKAAHNN